MKDTEEIRLYKQELNNPENKHSSVGEITERFYKKYPQFDNSSVKDALGETINDGDFLNVQNGKICQVKQIGNELYFAPYKKVELVRDYFRQDYIKHIPIK